MTKLPPAVQALLRSRKFLLTAFAMISTVALDGLGVDPAVWAAVDALVGVLIASIAYEDGAAKSASATIAQTNIIED